MAEQGVSVTSPSRLVVKSEGSGIYGRYVVIGQVCPEFLSQCIFSLLSTPTVAAIFRDDDAFGYRSPMHKIWAISGRIVFTQKMHLSTTGSSR